MQSHYQFIKTLKVSRTEGGWAITTADGTKFFSKEFNFREEAEDELCEFLCEEQMHSLCEPYEPEVQDHELPF